MPEKAVYTLTPSGNDEFNRLMIEISAQPINIFLDFNSVIVNLDSLSNDQKNVCLANISKRIHELKYYLEDNIRLKEQIPEIPEMGMTVLKQQLILTQAIEEWLLSLKKY